MLTPDPTCESAVCPHAPARGQGCLLPGILHLLSPCTMAASEFKANVVFLGGSPSPGTLPWRKSIQTNGGSPAGLWGGQL